MSPTESWRPVASRYALEQRAKLLWAIREFFAERKVLEVETPVLSPARNSDPNIEPMATEARTPRYLRTSPEYHMKRLLSANGADIYELGRVFRAGERGARHNPEFTILEWYRVGMPYLDLADEVIDLVRHCAAALAETDMRPWPVKKQSYRSLFEQYAGIDPFNVDETELSRLALERGIVSPQLNHSEWLDLFLSRVVQPGLPGEAFTVVYDYPPEQAALSRIRADDPPVAERFEVYLGQQELANGYQELTSAEEQRRRFEKERQLREIRGENKAPLDENLLAALEHGLPDCAGVALGVDRLLMSCLNVDEIDMVLAFPWERA